MRSTSKEHQKLKNLFGVAVKLRRVKLGLTQEELGLRAGLHRTYITDIERGVRNVSLGSIVRLAGALQVPVSTLFLEAEQSAPPSR